MKFAKMPKMLLLVTVIILVFGILTSASIGAPAVKGFKGNPGETYYMIVMMSGIEYWPPVYEMFKQCGRQLGVKTVYTGTPEYDVNKEITVFNQVLAKKPAGIFVHPMNADAFIEPINRATAMGIPVVTFAADSPKSNRVGYITSDNIKEGYYCADTLCKAIGGKGEVACLENPGQENHDLRVKSFIERVEKNWPGVKVVARAVTNQDVNKAYQAVKTMAQANPDLRAVFMPEATSGMGAAQAAKELGGKIKVLCCDVNAKVLDMIKAGDLWGALNPNQGLQGYFGMLTLFVAAHPNLVDPMTDYKAKKANPVYIPFIDNGLTIVTKENADYFYLDKYLAKRHSKGVEE
jgi:ribose transport system substrate-binding protein